MFYLKICFIEVLFSNTSQTCLILCKRFSISLMLSANLLWNMKHSKRSLKFEIPDKSNRNCSGISRGTSTALSLWALIMANSSEKKEKKLVKFNFTKTFLNLARFWQKKTPFFNYKTYRKWIGWPSLNSMYQSRSQNYQSCRYNFPAREFPNALI